MKKKVVLPLVGAALVVAAGVWWWQGPASGRAPAAVGGGQAAAALVTLAQATQQDVPMVLQLNGSVVSLNSVDLRPQITNTVREVHVKEGQFVQQGQLLFTLDDRADQANLAKARAQQMRDQATLADLERQYKRSQELVAQNFIAKSAADATLSQFESQKAAVAADRAAVQAAQVALGYSTLRAPIAGRIGAVNVYPGSLVQPTSSLVTITQLDPIAVSFPVPEANLQDLLAAARSKTRVEAVVSGRKEPLAGTLDFVDNTVDPQIGTVRAKAVFANADQSLWPGQFVETHITVRTLAGATVVPVAALMMLADGEAVFVVDGQQTAARRKVRSLYNFGAMVAVEGIKPGETVVVEGKQNVRDGGKVQTASTPPRPRNGSTDGASAASLSPADLALGQGREPA